MRTVVVKLHMGPGRVPVFPPSLEFESILSRGNVMVHVDTEQRQKGITMYFTFLYNTFQNHDLMRPWKGELAALR